MWQRDVHCFLKSIFSFVIFIFLPLHFHSLAAQNEKEYFYNRPITFRLSYQLLHSTHRTNFTGGSFDIDFAMSNHFLLGLGTQYAATPYHQDNGWVLTKLRFFPLYLNSIYTLCSRCLFQPYIHTEEGISFNHYNKLDTSISPVPFKVSEAGLYLSGNAGMNVTLSKRLKIFSEIGYKGFKHSFNDLDVNPHGVTVCAGLQFTSPM